LLNQIERLPQKATLKPMLRVLSTIVTAKHDRTAIADMQSLVLYLAEERAVQYHLRPVIESVLHKSAATAWVCSDMKTALATLDILSSKRVQVPGTVSVVGFDNWQKACERQVSTYDFNMDGMVKRALTMIVDRQTLSQAPLVTDIDGYVVERLTTRRNG
jgi:DNA-binding LacI/PurR family transcriptional regulator